MNTTSKKSTRVQKASIKKMLDQATEVLNNRNIPKGISTNVVGLRYETAPTNLVSMGNNRGKDKSFDPKRVTSLKEIIPTERYVWELSPIKTTVRNNKLLILDGHNRVQAVKELIKTGDLPKNYKVPFDIVDNAYVNSLSDSELIDFISMINNYDPRWSENEHYNAALGMDLVSALEFKRWVDYLETDSKVQEVFSYQTYDNKGVPKKTKFRLKKCAILTLVRKDLGKHKKKVLFSDYNDNGVIASKMRTPEFKKDVDNFVQLIGTLTKWHEQSNIQVGESYKAALSLIYDGRNDSPYDLKTLVEALNNVPAPTKIAGIKKHMQDAYIMHMVAKLKRIK